MSCGWKTFARCCLIAKISLEFMRPGPAVHRRLIRTGAPLKRDKKLVQDPLALKILDGEVPHGAT
jgi:hypothetical protein